MATQQTEDLARLLDFTEADLAANQQGFLSKRQKRRLFWRWLPSLFYASVPSYWWGLPIALAVVFTPLYVFIFVLDPLEMCVWPLALGWSGMWYYLTRPVRESWGHMRHDQREGRVSVMEGPVTPHIDFARGMRGVRPVKNDCCRCSMIGSRCHRR